MQCSSDNNVLWLVSVSAPVHCPLRVCVQDQLLINGRNHLALKNALAQQMQQQIIPGQVPAVVSTYTNYTVLCRIQCFFSYYVVTSWKNNTLKALNEKREITD